VSLPNGDRGFSTITEQPVSAFRITPIHPSNSVSARFVNDWVAEMHRKNAVFQSLFYRVAIMGRGGRNSNSIKVSDGPADPASQKLKWRHRVNAAQAGRGTLVNDLAARKNAVDGLRQATGIAPFASSSATPRQYEKFDDLNPVSHLPHRGEFDAMAGRTGSSLKADPLVAIGAAN